MEDVVQTLQRIHLTAPESRPNPVYCFPNIVPIEYYIASRGDPPVFPQSCLGGAPELERVYEEILCAVCDNLKILLSTSLGSRLRDARFNMIDSEDRVQPCVVVVVQQHTVLDWCALEGQIRALLAKSVARSALVFEVKFELAND